MQCENANIWLLAQKPCLKWMLEPESSNFGYLEPPGYAAALLLQGISYGPLVWAYLLRRILSMGLLSGMRFILFLSWVYKDWVEYDCF